MPIAISVNMLRLRVSSDCQPRTKNGQPAQMHNGRREHQLNPVRQGRVDPAVTADQVAAHFQDHRRQRKARGRSRSAASCRPVRDWAAYPGWPPRAPAPCRRSGSFRDRPGGSADASGRCRSCPPARRLSAALVEICVRIGGEFGSAAGRAEMIGFAAIVEPVLAGRGVDGHPADGVAHGGLAPGCR